MGVVSLNGSESELKGGVLEVDVWVQKPKTERAEKAPKQAWKQPVGEAGEKVAPLQAERGRQRAKVTGKGTKGTKGKAGKGDDKMKEKLAAFSASQKVWIGGLTEG